MRIRPLIYVAWILSLLFFNACALFPSPTPDAALMQQTVNAAAQQTSDAKAQEASPTQPSSTPTETETPTVTQTASPEPTLTDTPAPTDTPVPTLTDTATPEMSFPTALPGMATKDPVAKTQDMQSRIKTANILVFEDVSDGGETELVGRIDRVIEYMGITGGKVVNAHERAATFERFLKDGTPWDLIIIANESRRSFNTNLISLTIPFLKQKTALIVEAWNLDEDYNTGASFIMDYCGIRVEKNWYRSEDYKPEQFLFYNFAQNEPLFFYPNRINIPVRPTAYWMGDVGDLMNLYPGSRSRFAGGLISNDPSRYGIITVCDEGRVIVQTFSTHDYSYWDTITLWENYITHVLSNHFNVKP